MFRRPLLAMTVAALVPLFAAPALAANVNFHGTLSGDAEVPAKPGSGNGDVLATLDTKTKMLTYTVTFDGLSGPATAAHFHGPAAPGANAPVVVPLASPTSSPIHGTATLTDEQIKDLMAGRWYANVHTAANPGGEIRGQVTTGNRMSERMPMMHGGMKRGMSRDMMGHDMPMDKMPMQKAK